MLEPTLMTLEGIIRVNSKGIGFVDRETGDTIVVDTANLNTALDRDLVAITVTGRVTEGRRRGSPAGQVLRIIERARLDFIGVYKEEDGVGFVEADDKRMYTAILIPTAKHHGATPGQKVLARITTWTDPKKDPLGEIVQVIGTPGEHEVEMQSILVERGIIEHHPAPVEAEAEAIRQNFRATLNEEAQHRRDFRDVCTFTIDPEDAKDFDDALSWRRFPDGREEVGVHIADVSHYVEPGTALDDEAQDRATSIYLVDRTIPMLPEALSNDICSLVPNDERLTYSAVFTFDPKGTIIEEWFGRTIIRSAKRFTYENAQTVLDEKTGDYAEALAALNRLAHRLRKDKFAAGAIAFEDEEVKFVLDEQKRPVSVCLKERGDTHKLIEDFMLLANRRVAEFVSKKVKGKPGMFVYRIHDLPDPERLAKLGDFLKPLGYTLHLERGAIHARDINEVLNAALGTVEEKMVHTATIRAMAKAVYSMQNIGHFGLAFPHYTHFTSPIRRYPDLLVHRLLTLYLENTTPSAELLAEYDRLVAHATEMEQRATEAERDSIKYKQAEYMESRIGEEFDGIVSGVTEWGVYVEEKISKSEGMVRLRDMKDDYYVYDEKRLALTGERTKKTYRLGDTVRIKVLHASRFQKQIDYAFV